MMYILINSVFLILFTLNYSTGYQWLPLQSGDPVPEDAILIDPEYHTYVGRTRHYNSVLPAEVYNETESYALISSCGTEIVKHHFEILVSMEKCKWKSFASIEDIPASVVRAGTAKNGEPIFVGKTDILINERWDYDLQRNIQERSNNRIASILLTTNSVNEWEYNHPNSRYSLVCDDDNTWVDTSAAQIPNNTISGGKSEDNDEIFVARLLNDCAVVAGQVIPKLGIATAVYGGEQLDSPFCQVLVGDSNEYHWVPAKHGEIPDYAVVAGKYKKKELMYVARVNKTLGYILHSEGLAVNTPYEILAKKNN